jgi:fluoroacetyl-CoA thioesterase
VTPKSGLVGRVTLLVSEADTAAATGSGDVPVLATPRLVALADEAACRALDGVLAPGSTSVGMRVQFDHLAPIAVGTEVTAEAVLERVEGKRLTFTVSAFDHAGLIGAGRMTRVVVDVDSFMAKAR